MAIADKITTFRQQDPLFRDLSFDTISASGPHGICHYRVSEKVNRTVNVQDILLVDSGGQYLDGTTDITRTICFAPPAPHIKDHFTRVLQGHIQLASCRFPENSTGRSLMCWRALPYGRLVLILTMVRVTVSAATSTCMRGRSVLPKAQIQRR